MPKIYRFQKRSGRGDLENFSFRSKMLVINKVFQREHLPAEFERKQRQQQDGSLGFTRRLNMK